MDVKMFARKYGSYGQRINKIAEKYNEACNREFSNQREMKIAKADMIKSSKEFERLRDTLEKIPAPNDFRKEKKKMDELFDKYVSYIVKKTEKFNLESIRNGEIDRLTELELNASKRYKEYLIDFTNKHVM